MGLLPIAGQENDQSFHGAPPLFVRTRLCVLDIPASNFEIDSRVFHRMPLREPSIPLERALWHEGGEPTLSRYGAPPSCDFRPRGVWLPPRGGARLAQNVLKLSCSAPQLSSTSTFSPWFGVKPLSCSNSGMGQNTMGHAISFRESHQNKSGVDRPSTRGPQRKPSLPRKRALSPECHEPSLW
jgi:hypothetical protein